jgi:uncharacterized protein (DUF2384 family)
LPSTAHEVGALFAIVAGVGMATRLWSRRQSTTAWATGAQGERVVAARLAKVASKGVSVICDRRIPGSRAGESHSPNDRTYLESRPCQAIHRRSEQDQLHRRDGPSGEGRRNGTKGHTRDASRTH